MKKRWIIISTLLGVIIVVGGVMLMKLFLFGSLMSVDRVPIYDVSMNNSNILLTGEFQDSALAFKGYKYRVNGEAIFIKVYSVLVSPIYKSGTIQIKIDGDFSQINSIFIEDSINQKILWQR